MTERQKALRIKQLKEKRRRLWRRMAIGLRLLAGTIVLLLVVWLLVGVTRSVRMNELKKQNVQLSRLEEDLESYSKQNETMEAMIRDYEEALRKYEDSPKSQQQMLLEQYEDEIVNLNHELEDVSLEAAEVQEQIASYKKLLGIGAKEEVTLPEPETTEEIPTLPEETSVEQPPVEQPPVEQPPVKQPPVEQPPVEQPPVEQPPEEYLGEDGDFEHE